MCRVKAFVDGLPEVIRHDTQMRCRDFDPFARKTHLWPLLSP
jgi:hypothetical protein